MQYKRDFMPLKECTSGYGRGGMVPHGIVRMEQQGQILKLRVNIYGLAPGAGPYTVYAVWATADVYKKQELGQLQPDGLGRCELGYRTDTAIRILDEKETIGTLCAVLVILSDGTEILTGTLMDWKKLKDVDALPEVCEVQRVPEEPEVSEPMAPEPTEEPVITEQEASSEEILPLRTAAGTTEDEGDPITSTAAAKDALQYMLQVYPRIYPFRDTETRWIRIHPRDIAPLPTDVVALESSPFLQRGYLQYKHLIMGYDGEVYYVGVPFRYEQEQEEIAHNWGFPEFRNSFGTVPMKGDYGYWLRPVRFEN